MLDKIDLSRKLSKAEYKASKEDMQRRIGLLQREARALGIPVIVVFEGWDAAGKGTQINRLLLSLDARGFKVNPTNAPTEEERLRPFLWRFWIKTPAKGRIAIFDRSWYGRVLVGRVDRIVKKAEWSRAYDEINAFERQLTDDGCVIFKLFLHISKKEQKKRFKKLLAAKATEWKVSKEDWKHHRQYDRYLAATDEMLERTSQPHAPWTVVEAEDQRYASAKIFQTFIHALEEAVNKAKRRRKRPPAARTSALPAPLHSVLETVDPSISLTRKKYEKALKHCQKRIWDLEHEIYVRRVPVMILYEGWDAGGKGGNIKRLVQSMDPRGYEVIPIAAPNDVEKAHHYLWRFWKHIPKAGHIAIFDRTWYGRVLVERVEQFCSTEEWKRAYGEINELEKQFVDFGGVMVKFWLQIDQDEQLRRFKEREKNRFKRWKITDEDWRNREKWDAYNRAVDEMLIRTSTTHAPWTIVEANCKLHARIKALTTVIESIQSRL